MRRVGGGSCYTSGRCREYCLFNLCARASLTPSDKSSFSFGRPCSEELTAAPWLTTTLAHQLIISADPPKLLRLSWSAPLISDWLRSNKVPHFKLLQFVLNCMLLASLQPTTSPAAPCRLWHDMAYSFLLPALFMGGIVSSPSLKLGEHPLTRLLSPDSAFHGAHEN